MACHPRKFKFNCPGNRSTALRPRQIRQLERIDDAIAEGCYRLVAQAPTGYGKTVLIAHRLRLLQDTCKRALLIVPTLSLIDQSVEKLYAEGVRDIGVIQASHVMTNWARPIQIASVQTLTRRGVPDADEIHIDEVHRWFDLYPKLLADPRFASTPIVGWSATPWTKGLGKHFERLIVGATTQDLIDEKLLSPFRAFAPASPDLSSVRTVAGDFRDDDLAAAMNKVELVADVATTWLERAEGRPTLCFAVDRAHARGLQQQFQSENIPAEYIDCYTDAAERNAIARRFHNGVTKVVCNVGCLTTGIDWDVRCIVLARPTKSEVLYVQMIGRGLRTAAGKTDCLILDHSDNHARLGFVTDIHHEELDDGVRHAQRHQSTRDEPLPKPCPKCTFLKPAKVHVCPCCGFAPAPQTRAVHLDGELVEVGAAARAKSAVRDGVDEITFYCELKGYAIERQFSEGWCAHQFKAKFNNGFPPWAWRHFAPRTPTSATRAWIRSRSIAWARSSW